MWPNRSLSSRPSWIPLTQKNNMAPKSTVYTRTGDQGSTSLVGGSRVSKTDPRLEAYGTVDELNSWLGLLYAEQGIPAEAKPVLFGAMNTLFDIGAILATEPESSWQPKSLPQEKVEALEKAIDEMDARLPKHNRFILPSGHPAAARANIARTVARRAERRILAVPDAVHDPVLLRFINRLSDYLFILSRAINIFNGEEEIFWSPDC